MCGSSSGFVVEKLYILLGLMVTMRNLEGLKKGQGWNKGHRSGVYEKCLCGKSFYRYPSEKQIYCSRKCAYENRPIYKKQILNTYRTVARVHLKQVCIVCSKESGLVVHHKDGNRNNNSVSNLEYRCYKHHVFGENAVHPHPRNRKGIKWSEDMKKLIGERTKQALHKKDIRKRHLEALSKIDKKGKKNPMYKHGRYCQ